MTVKELYNKLETCIEEGNGDAPVSVSVDVRGEYFTNEAKALQFEYCISSPDTCIEAENIEDESECKICKYNKRYLCIYGDWED